MGDGIPGNASLRDRLGSALEAMRSSFGFPAAVAMVLGLGIGFAMPALDTALDVDVPVFEFAGQDAARSLLETVATTTVAVAGLAFSVTVVAFTLAASQLSPRVLRTFRADRLSQLTLACFLGTFIYCLAVLVRLGSTPDGPQVPNLSITVAVVLAIASFALFTAFIAHIVRMLQPSSVIDGIRSTGREVVAKPYPAGVGSEPDDEEAAWRAVERRRGAGDGTPVRARDDGYLSSFRAQGVLAAAAACDALVEQRVEVGDYVMPGTELARIWCDDDERREALVERVRDAFVCGRQRTPVQDPAFPIRQLADIALKGLSPGINDPTTAENAMEALTALLIHAAQAERPSPLRTDEDGTVRLVARAPDLDALVRLGFEQAQVFAASDPVVSRRLVALLERVELVAAEAGLRCKEPARQAARAAVAAETAESGAAA